MGERAVVVVLEGLNSLRFAVEILEWEEPLDSKGAFVPQAEDTLKEPSRNR